MTRLSLTQIRDLYANDPIVLSLCDWAEQAEHSVRLTDEIFGRIGMSPVGWGVTGVNMTMAVADVPRLSVELIETSGAHYSRPPVTMRTFGKP
jgi:hypothetical protein